MPQDVWRDRLVGQRGTRLGSHPYVLAEDMRKADAGHGSSLRARKEFWNGDGASHCEPGPQIIGRLWPQGQGAFATAFAGHLHGGWWVKGHCGEGEGQQFRLSKMTPISPNARKIRPQVAVRSVME